MLASVYSYRVMVKSVSSCCVHGRWVLSNPVTYTHASASYVMNYDNNTSQSILQNDFHTLEQNAAGKVFQ